ncbi:protein of unknown function [Limnospira indica PCC 8005]|uniref:Uncharacterized protein n=1 Tax=Limnospira indica PCC 8005 TaxID=376219 RepID=A0A9P1NWZ6_9CYAN|nr:protein of unknown function [Limnospira indica PCC 8005]
MSSNVIVIQDSQFETEVLGNTGQPTLAYFWAGLPGVVLVVWFPPPSKP